MQNVATMRETYVRNVSNISAKALHLSAGAKKKIDKNLQQIRKLINFIEVGKKQYIEMEISLLECGKISFAKLKKKK